MARGRMINNKITRNKAINDLSDDTSRLAYTWLVTFADVEGRTNGDPALVRSLVFPRRTDVSVAQMEAYIREWAAAGLVVWYEADGDLWISFPTFAENQRGLDRRKEPDSEIPAPPDAVPSTDPVRTAYVPDTAEEKLREAKEKRRESSGAVAEAAPTAPAHREPTAAQQRLGAVEEHFAAYTGLSKPPRDTEAQKKAGATLWWLPLKEILRLCDDDVGRANGLIDETVTDMRARGLDICDPKSIVRIARGKHGARASPGGNGKNEYFNDPEVYARAGREWDAR